MSGVGSCHLVLACPFWQGISISQGAQVEVTGPQCPHPAMHWGRVSVSLNGNLHGERNPVLLAVDGCYAGPKM